VSEHPDLTAALRASEGGEWGQLLGIALRSREAALDEGRYCECAEPALAGDSLVCGACLLRNRGQEVRAVLRIVSPHRYVARQRRDRPGQTLPICESCATDEGDPRHHGVPAVGMTSWGEEVRP
jgi:hypothetical protein